MSEHTKGPWLRDGKTVYVLNDQGFNRFCAQVQDAHTPEAELEANARRIVACVNACDSDGLPTAALEALVAKGGRLKGADWYVDMLDRQLEQAEDRTDWIQQVNTLHRQVDILYVVDGYEVTVTWDGHAISPDFHGATVAEAIDKAMARFDLSEPPKWIAGDRVAQDPVDRQLAAVEKQRDQLQLEVSAGKASLQRVHDRWYAAAETTKRLTAERDALLAALEAIAADDFEVPYHASDSDLSREKGQLIRRMTKAAQAAIAAAKGGAV